MYVFDVGGGRIETELGVMDEIVALFVYGTPKPGGDFHTMSLILDVTSAAKIIFGLGALFHEAGRGEELETLVRSTALRDYRAGHEPDSRTD